MDIITLLPKMMIQNMFHKERLKKQVCIKTVHDKNKKKKERMNKEEKKCTITKLATNQI